MYVECKGSFWGSWLIEIIRRMRLSDPHVAYRMEEVGQAARLLVRVLKHEHQGFIDRDHGEDSLREILKPLVLQDRYDLCLELACALLNPKECENEDLYGITFDLMQRFPYCERMDSAVVEVNAWHYLVYLPIQSALKQFTSKHSYSESFDQPAHLDLAM
jgi:hypothetical protein